MKQLQQVFDNAELLFSLADIELALNQLAAKLNQQFANSNPILLCVMNGSVVTTGQLLPKLNFPLELDYIHATRYGDKTIGGTLNWLHKPVIELKNRTVIIIEDIFDEGITLHALRAYCQQAGAKAVYSLSLINKQHDNKTGQNPDFIGLNVPNRYVFGFGMDYQNYWRNAPGIYAVKETN